MTVDSVVYGARSVGVRDRLHDVSLEVAAGSVTAVVGGDGAGKTTLLRLLVGAMLPDTGAVLAPARAEAIGYAPTGTGYYADLTVAENLEFAAHAYSMDRGSYRARSAHVLGLTGLDEFAGRLARDLSGGMRQKLALATATLHEPEMLVLDEPTTGVDPVSRTDLWRIIASEAASGVHVVVATSYLDEAERATSVVALEEGSMLLRGTPDDLRNGVPGSLVDLARPTDRDRAWRVGNTWRQWRPDGRAGPEDPEHQTEVRPGLEDAVIVATLGRRLGEGGP